MPQEIFKIHADEFQDTENGMIPKCLRQWLMHGVLWSTPQVAIRTRSPALYAGFGKGPCGKVGGRNGKSPRFLVPSNLT
jgi:hypothetical protein